MSWGIGSKSLVFVESRAIHGGWPNGNSLRQECWHEAPRGEQISEEVAKEVFCQTLVLAKEHPQRAYHYIRMDAESSPPTLNNNSYGGDIDYQGYHYHRNESGWLGEGKQPDFKITMSDGSQRRT